MNLISQACINTKIIIVYTCGMVYFPYNIYDLFSIIIHIFFGVLLTIYLSIYVCVCLFVCVCLCLCVCLCVYDIRDVFTMYYVS